MHVCHTRAGRDPMCLLGEDTHQIVRKHSLLYASQPWVLKNINYNLIPQHFNTE